VSDKKKLLLFCNAEVSPECSDDFVWENNKFGIRAYGSRDYHKWLGFDVFNKSNPSNVCLKWCHRIDKGNFHKNRHAGSESIDGAATGLQWGVTAIPALRCFAISARWGQRARYCVTR
jgi:hypothetical protein